MKTHKCADTPNGKQKRGRKGEGYLYRRGRYYWLEYRQPDATTGEMVRRREILRDRDGNKITTREGAETARQIILAPMLAADSVEAERIAAARLMDAERAHAAAVEAARPGLRIADAWNQYQAHPERPDAGEATLRQYGFQWQRFMSWLYTTHPEAVNLSDVTPDIARAYAAELKDPAPPAARLSANTFNKHVGFLSLVFRVLRDDAGIVLNPWERIARKKQIAAGRRELTTEELRRIITTAEGEARMLYALGVYTGLRLGDCATLKWTEVDLLRGRIVRVPNKTARSNGKPVQVPLYRDLANLLTEAKPDARAEYVLPATAAVYERKGADVLTRRIQRHFWNCGIDCHAAGTGFQIVRDEDGNPKQTTRGNAELKPTGKRAAIRCGFHSLRHSFVSLCREAGAPLSVVESIVGHSNPAMTRHYSHTSDLEAAKAVAALPAVMAPHHATPAPEPKREPLPAWARSIIENLPAGPMSAKTWTAARTALMQPHG